MDRTVDDDRRTSSTTRDKDKKTTAAAAAAAAATAALPQIEVRELALEDLPAVFALGERIFPAERWPNLYRTWDEYEVVGFFQSDGETCFVADIDGKVAGFVLGTLIEKRRNAWVYGYLVWIGVDPDAGRRGVGAKLLRRLNERFIELGARIVLVDTDATNLPAIRFFEREGFGHRMEHVYMSMNLTQRPEYQKLRQRTAHKRPPAAAQEAHHHAGGGKRRRPGGGSYVRSPVEDDRATPRNGHHTNGEGETT